MIFEEWLLPKPPGLDRDEIIDRANQLARHTWDRFHFEMVRQFCSPRIVCEFIGDKSHIPYAGRHVGIESLTRIVRMINVDFEQLNCSAESVVVDGGRVAIRRSVEWRHRGTGRRGLVELADFAKFEDGLLVELVEYRDAGAILWMQGQTDPR